jgi:hypothetical protein
MRMESLRLNHTLAMEAESALAAVFRRLFLDRLLRSARGGKKEKFAVRENAVHIEKQQFDFLGTRLRIGHARIVTNRCSLLVIRCCNEQGSTATTNNE